MEYRQFGKTYVVRLDRGDSLPVYRLRDAKKSRMIFSYRSGSRI